MFRKLSGRVLALIVLLLIFRIGSGQKIASFEILVPGGTHGFNIPVSTNLDRVTFLPDTLLSLSEIKGNSCTERYQLY